MYLPTGKLGKVVWEEKEFQIQTEFSNHPRPHLTTTVFLGGEVVHKVDNLWLGGVETDEDQRALDRQLVLQHRETSEYLDAKVRKKVESKKIFEIDDLKRLVLHPSALGYLTASGDGVLQMEGGLTAPLKEIAFLFSELVIFLGFLEKNTKLGRFYKGEGNLEPGRLYLGQVPEIYVGISVAADAPSDSIKEEFFKLLPGGEE